MYATTIIAYAYEAALHCPDCTAMRFPDSISGEKKKEERVERKHYHRLERSYGSFRRSFTLRGEVQAQKAAAKFKDGVLEIRIPKTEEAKRKEKKVMIE